MARTRGFAISVDDQRFVTNTTSASVVSESAELFVAAPVIRTVVYPGDDTAANTVGGQTIQLTGNNFRTGVQVYVNGNAVPSVTYNSSSNVVFTTPALGAATYPIYLVNTDGSVAIFVPGLQVSGEPTWSTGATLPEQSVDDTWSISLSATSDSSVTYALADGSTLPSGISLAANGLISGTMSSPPAEETTYNFTVVASDAENQDASRAFSVTVTLADEYFKDTVLLLHGDGTNNQNNSVFLDSSNNNFTITNSADVYQGSFSPFSQTGWSNYFDRNGDTLQIADDPDLEIGSGDFTVEAWIYLDKFSGTYGGSFYGSGICGKDSNGTRSYSFAITASGTSAYTGLSVVLFTGGGNVSSSVNFSFQLYQWYHVAFSRQSGIIRFFVDGQLIGSASNPTSTNNGTHPFAIGASGLYPGYEYFFPGYISNFRFVNGTALYTENFTPSATPLSNITNTAVLTCQSNRFIDNSNNNFTITRNGDVSVQAYSPFAPTSAYSTANVGGSGYFDGSEDLLTITSAGSALSLDGDFTVEFWLYPTAFDGSYRHILSKSYNNNALKTGGNSLYFYNGSSYTYINGVPFRNNEWQHVAWVRSGSNSDVYVNGVKNITLTTFTSTVDWGTTFTISNTGENLFPTHISNLRILKGTALYSDNFTPPTSAPTNIANTVLLMNFANAGIFDHTAKNMIKLVGDAKVSTTQSKFGGSSMYFDGTGDWLQIPASRNLEVSGDVTIEFWVYWNSIGNIAMLFGWGAGASGKTFAYTYSDGRIAIGINGTNEIASAAGQATTGVWTHIAIVRYGSTTTIYKNGLSIASSTTAVWYASTGTEAFYIGGSGSVTDIDAYIDDLRVTRGVARYTSNFTPPAAFKDR